MYESLLPVGWGDRWEALLAEHGPDVEPGRVLRHDGVAVAVLTAGGERTVKLRRGVDPVTVGDWLALRDDVLVASLERSSLLRRRAAGTSEDTQLLAANVDLVLLVCGLDRPVRAGRIQRGEALAWDAGATPLLVLTKADLADDIDAVTAELEAEGVTLEPIVTSSTRGDGIEGLRQRLVGSTTVLLGESGAGKSRLVNTLMDAEVAVTGVTRSGDGKGRHTTTNRQLHRLPDGGVLVDSPGIREVGLASDEEAVEATFADIEELALECKFNDCAHAGEPGCAVVAAVADGRLAQERLDQYEELIREGLAVAERAEEAARRAAAGRQLSKDQKRYYRDHPGRS